LTVAGRRCLDAGASTGGFTDVLLRREAREVVAVDVGYGQLIWRLQNDERVDVHDRTNVRALTPDQIGGRVELGVADLSFISLSLVLPALADCVEPGGDLLPMVKPQFQVGKDRVGAGGVVRDPALRIEAVAEVARDAAALGLRTRGVVASPLPGPAGNVEYFIWLHKPDIALHKPDIALPESDIALPTPREATRTGDMSSSADRVGDRSASAREMRVDPEIMAMIVAAVEAGPR
jgi:23S rRNA (cytidine1920-2'-O)/16S rRNA (cytidine1409-2'-O)-methyltransferase